MTPFEQGYAAFLAGVGKDDNPFDDETKSTLSRPLGRRLDQSPE